MSAEPTVFVVDDDAALGQSLRWLLQSVGLTVEVYGSAEDFLSSANLDAPGCVLLDVRMPGMSGLACRSNSSSAASGCRSSSSPAMRRSRSRCVRSKRGLLDFIEKPFSDQLMVDRVRQAIEINRKARAESAAYEEIAARFALLTPREREVMERVVEGKANKVIAADLGIGEKTIEVHRSQVMRKLRAESIAQLTRMWFTYRKS